LTILVGACLPEIQKVALDNVFSHSRIHLRLIGYCSYHSDYKVMLSASLFSKAGDIIFEFSFRMKFIAVMD